MLVADILKTKGNAIETVKMEQSLRITTQTLASRNIGALVVTNGEGGLCGIISERDIIRAIAENGAAAMESNVKAFMTANVVTCTAADTIVEVMGRMTQGRFRHMPIVDGDQLVGIISIGDVVKHRIAETEFEVEAMRGYIASG